MDMRINVRTADITISLSRETIMKSENREMEISELADKYKCDVIDFVIIEEGGAYFSAIVLDKGGSIELSDYPSRSFIYEGDELPPVLCNLIDGKNVVSDEEMMTSMEMSGYYEGSDVITSSDLMWYMMSDEGKGWGGHTSLSTIRELEGDRFVVVFHAELFELIAKKELKRYAMDAILSVSNVRI